MYQKFESLLPVGHDQIDREHQMLAYHINDFLEKLESGQDRERIECSYLALFDYTALHFSHEEQIMKEAGYYDIDIHTQRHKKLLAELQEKSRYILGGLEDDLVDVISFFYDWFSFHIKTSDVQLAEFLKQQSVARAPG